MNIYTNFNRSTAQFVAALAMFAMLLSALPVHFFVAEAALGDVVRLSDTASFSTLQEAHDDAGTLAGDTLTLTADLVTTGQVTITKAITIDGNGNEIDGNFTKTSNSNNSVIGVLGDDVSIVDIEVTSSGDAPWPLQLHGINVYNVTGVVLEDILATDLAGTGVLVNSSVVTASDITTSGNGWHGINVDQKTANPAVLHISETSEHSEILQLYVDDTTKDVTIDDVNDQYETSAPGIFPGEATDRPNDIVYTLKVPATLEITDTATDGEVVVGEHTFEAEYVDNDETEDDIKWAIRPGVCETSSENLAGNVGGLSDASSLVGTTWSATVDMSTWTNGDYCLIVNPQEGDDEDLREVRDFTLENEAVVPVCEIGDNLLLNASFEDPAIDGSWSLSSIANWVITKVSDNTPVDGELWRGLFGGPSDGEQNVELDSTEPTKLTQTVATIPGATYELRFDFSPRKETGIADNDVDALADAAVVVNAAASGDENSTNDWNTYSGTFVADGSTDISFVDNGTANGQGSLIDNAVLCLVSEPEPEDPWCAYDGTVIEHTADVDAKQNDGDLVEAARRNPAAVETVAPYQNIGGKEGNDWNVNPLDFYTLGIEGYLVYEFTSAVAIDQAGADIAVYEITGGTGSQTDEKIEVSVSKNGVDFVSLGEFTGDAQIDIAPAGLDYVKFVRLDDKSAGIQGNNGDGYDVDAIVILNGSCGEAPRTCEVTLVSDTNDFVVETGENAKLLSFIHTGWTAVIDGASWIWGDDPVVDSSIEETQTFVKQFGFLGAITSATLYVASDNSHDADLNGSDAGEATEEQNFRITDQDEYDVTSLIQQGNNDLSIAVKNWAGNSNPQMNPAGLMYKLHIEGEVTTDDDCSVPYIEEPDPVTVVAHKIVCTDEADIPNSTDWGDLDPISGTTAQDWVDEHKSCDLVPDWEFQWAPVQNDPGDTFTGEAGAPWTTFGLTNAAGMTSVDIAADNTRLWFREVLQEGYIPFTHEATGNEDDYTAAFYCNNDVLNYDNLEWIDVEAGETYNCVAWNMPAEKPLVCEPGVNLIANGSFEDPEVDGDWDIFDLTTYPALAWAVEFVAPFIGAPEEASLELHAGVNGWLSSSGDQYAELDSDWQGPEGTSGEEASVMISQTIDTIPGEEYRLSWDFSPRPGTTQPENDLEVFVSGLGKVANNTAAGAGANVWSSDSYTFTATDVETTVSFADDGDANSVGTFLDNVSLVCNPEPEAGPYCGDGVVNQEWEQCDGGEGCADYCLWDNQCHDEQLVKITLDPQAPESVSFNNTIFLGNWNNPIPSGAWFNFNEVDSKTAQKIAKKSDGLGVERTGSELRLAVKGKNSKKEFDYAFGTVEVLGLEMGSLDKSPVVGWPLEDAGDYPDVFTKNNNVLDFEFYLTTGNDAGAVALTAGDEYGYCPSPDDELYTIQGYVWHDDNENQIWDGVESEQLVELTEESLAGWTVWITNGSLTFSTTTDSEGRYYFNVPAGTWTITETEEDGWGLTTQTSHEVTVPELFTEAQSQSVFAALMNYVIPTAHAVAFETVKTVYGDYNFGNNETQTRRSGGGGRRSSGGGGDDAATNLPAGAVLGDQVSIVPLGAADAGHGGTAPVQTGVQLLAAAFVTRNTRKNA